MFAADASDLTAAEQKKEITKMYLLRQTTLALTICAGLVTGFLTTLSANAQCAAGLGETPLLLATQAWPPTQTGIDFTSFTATSSTTGPVAHPDFVTASSIAADGQGSIYVMDTAPSPGNPSGSLLQLHFNGTSLSLVQALESRTQLGPQTQVYFAGGFVWTVNSHGVITPYLAGFNLNPDNATTPSLGTPATGATYDGKYVWFTTANGTLAAIVPPVLTTSSTGENKWSIPQIAEKITVGGSLTGAIFDGSNIWTNSGNQLVAVNPVSGSVANYTMPSPIANVFFDGASLWVGSQTSASIYQFDPIQRQLKSTLPAAVPGHVFSTGNLFRISYQAGGQVATMRTCDGVTVGSSNLPQQPIQSAFDGSQVWTVYGNGTVSVR